MNRVFRYAGQAVVYAAIALFLGWFSAAPEWNRFPVDAAMIRLSLAHGGAREECRRLTAAEIAELPPNMRQPVACSRQRRPVYVELLIDGEMVYSESLPPTGLAGDGPSRAWAGFPVPAGRHVVVARLRDTDRADGFDYTREEEVDLAPLSHFVIRFRPETGGFIFR